MTDPHTRAPEGTAEAAHAREERELRAVAALLRGLPDPEPPAGLADRIVARAAERDARSKVIRLLRPLRQPAFAGALAAGLGCLAILTSLEGSPLATTSTAIASEPERLRPSVARRVSSVTTADASAARLSRPVVPSFASAAVIDSRLPTFADPQLPGFGAAPIAAPQPVALPSAGAQARTTTRSTASERGALLQDRRLDRQLNHLMLNPTAFAERLDGIRDSERFFARLADRAARRGDAVDIALALRQQAARDARTDWMVERMLRAALVQEVGQR